MKLTQNRFHFQQEHLSSFHQNKSINPPTICSELFKLLLFWNRPHQQLEMMSSCSEFTSHHVMRCSRNTHFSRHQPFYFWNFWVNDPVKVTESVNIFTHQHKFQSRDGGNFLSCVQRCKIFTDEAAAISKTWILLICWSCSFSLRCFCDSLMHHEPPATGHSSDWHADWGKM